MVLDLIDKEQKESKSNKFNLSQMVGQWKTIETHLQKLCLWYQHLNRNLNDLFLLRIKKCKKQLKSYWDLPIEKKVLDVYLVAYQLDPVNHSNFLDFEQIFVFWFLCKYVNLMHLQ